VRERLGHLLPAPVHAADAEAVARLLSGTPKPAEAKPVEPQLYGRDGLIAVNFDE